MQPAALPRIGSPMNTSFHFAGVALVLCAAFAAEAAQTDAEKAAGDACESSVADTVRRMRGRDALEEIGRASCRERVFRTV